MERSLRVIASSLALLCGTMPGAVPAAGNALCEPGASDGVPLDAAQRARCRQLWQERIEAARERNRRQVEQSIEESRQRREHAASLPPPPPASVTVETFIGNGDLAYGDVVVTDKGPRVFVGQPGEPARPEDFVALDSARSPHRGQARSYDGAYPQPQRPRGAKPRPAASSRQERQP